MRQTNHIFELKSNIRHYLTADYNERKEAEKEQGNKYPLVDYCEEVAQFCGVSASTVSQIRLKNLQPSLVVGMRLSKFLNVPIDLLWQIEEKKEEEQIKVERCIVEGCERQGGTKGYCITHYHTEIANKINRTDKEIKK